MEGSFGIHTANVVRLLERIVNGPNGKLRDTKNRKIRHERPEYNTKSQKMARYISNCHRRYISFRYDWYISK